MPIFRYICRSCKAEFELLLPHFDSPAECPKCASEDLEKQLNKVGAISVSKGGCAMSSQCPSANAGSCCAGCCHHKH